MRDAREAIVLVCRRLYERGLVAGPDGNVSVRRDDGTLIVTPTGLAKVDVTPDDLVVVSLEGLIREGRRAPSSELGMHLRIYQRRPDIRAVVHAHPPAATGFAVAGESFMAPVLPEVILQLGEVPLVPYATPGSDALADAFAPSLEAAHQRMESLEHAARILLAARGLGRVNELSAADVRSLRATREESR